MMSVGERCDVADAAHPLLTANNRTIGVELEGKSLLSVLLLSVWYTVSLLYCMPPVLLHFQFQGLFSL